MREVFYIMWKEIETCRITLEDNRRELTYEPLSEMRYLPFKFSDVKLPHIYDFMESRCFPPNRANCRQLLDIMGLESYDPWKIVKYTHGVKHDDMYWVRWEGKDYQWQEVCTEERRYHI